MIICYNFVDPEDEPVLENGKTIINYLSIHLFFIRNWKDRTFEKANFM